jgi:hypothetical protein
LSESGSSGAAGSVAQNLARPLSITSAFRVTSKNVRVGYL